MTLGGSSQPSRQTFGGMTLDGSAVVRRNYGYMASGGYTRAGSATPRLGFVVVASGGYMLGGSAMIGRQASGSGGISLGGVAPIGHKTTGSGGYSLSGVAMIGRLATASGGYTLAGSADLHTWYVLPSGGLTLGGSAINSTPFAHFIGSGGYTFARGNVLIDFGGRIELGPSLGGIILVESALSGNASTDSVFAGQVTL
jgi:hypothetical protein